MRDRGTLYASDETGGITAVVILDNDELALEVDGEAWGNWHVSVVEIAVIGSNEFQLGLGGDVLRSFLTVVWISPTQPFRRSS